MNPYLGEIRIFAGNFAPKNWAFCNGQILPISTNTALFSLLGTTYGGNGVNTFALPDFRGRLPLSSGQRPGFQDYPLGAQSGQESVTLTQLQMPAHSHAVNCTSAQGNQSAHATKSDPAGNFPAPQSAGSGIYHPTTSGSTMHPQMTSATGGGQSHENRQPFLTLNFIICMSGIFPPRP